jgi:MFS transporter, FHS family, L-fucose permease
LSAAKSISAPGTLSARDTVISMLFLGIMFFVFGFVTWVNAILIPYFKIACELSNFESYLVAFAFYISYLLISVPAGFLLRLVGFKRGMMVGFWIMALGAFIFIEAANTRTYALFLTGLFAIGAGLAILQTATNPYVTILGARERAAQRMSIMGVCNKAAGILAPLLFAAVILRPTDGELFRQIKTMAAAEKHIALDELIRRVMIPYAFVGTILFGLGLAVRYSLMPEIDTEQESESIATANAGKKSIFDFPHLILGAVAIFLHVGTQVLAIDTIIGYAATMQIHLPEAKVFPSYTLSCTIIGYLIGIVTIPRYISQGKAFIICTVLGAILSVLVVSTGGTVFFLGHHTDISIWWLALLGLANSLIWASIWPLALDGLGKFTKVGASVLIMGLCGNALLPLLYGWLADRYTLKSAYWILLPCYLYLLFYALYGHRIRRWTGKRPFTATPVAETTLRG